MKTKQLPLGGPVDRYFQRQSHQLLGGELRRIFAVNNRSDDIGRQRRKAQEARDVAGRDVLLAGNSMQSQPTFRLPVRGEAAASRENCARLRDELWFKGREWFQDRACCIPQDDALIAELTSPTYTFTSTGKMVVESKADMKKRGMRSPDLADAFLLTFGGGERRKIERYRKPAPRNHSAWAV